MHKKYNKKKKHARFRSRKRIHASLMNNRRTYVARIRVKTQWDGNDADHWVGQNIYHTSDAHQHRRNSILFFY